MAADDIDRAVRDLEIGLDPRIARHEIRNRRHDIGRTEQRRRRNPEQARWIAPPTGRLQTRLADLHESGLDAAIESLARFGRERLTRGSPHQLDADVALQRRQ